MTDAQHTTDANPDASDALLRKPGSAAPIDGVPDMHADAADHVPRSAASTSSVSGRWWRWPLRGLVTVAVLLLMVLAVGLAGVRYGGIPLAMWQLERWYSPQGEGYHASLGAWHLSFTQGELVLTDFYLKHPSEASPDARTGWQSLSLDLDTHALMQMLKSHVITAVTGDDNSAPAVVIENVAIIGLELAGRSDMNAVDTPSRLALAGLTLPLPTETSDQPEPEADSGSVIGVKLEQLRLSDWQLEWAHQDHTADLNARLELALPLLTLQNLDTRSVTPLHLALQTQLRQLAVSLPAPDSGPLTEPVSLDLQQPVSLDWSGQVSDWQGAQPQLAGTLSLDQLQLTLMKDVTLGLTHLGIQQLQASAAEQAFQALDVQGLSIRMDSSPDTHIDLYRYLIDGLVFDSTHRGLPLLKLGKQQVEGLAVSANLDAQGLPAGLDWLDLGAGSKTAAQVTASGAAGAEMTDRSGLPVLLKTEPVDMKDWSLVLQHPLVQTGLTIPAMTLGSIDSEQVSAIRHEGKLVVESLSLPDARTALLQPLKLRWSTQLHDWLRQPRMTGQTRLDTLAVQVADQPQLSLDHLALTGIDASAAHQSVRQLQLQQLVVRHGPEQLSTNLKDTNKPLLVLASLSVPELSLDKQHLSTGVIEFSGVKMRVLKRANGQLAGLPETGQESGQKREKTPEALSSNSGASSSGTSGFGASDSGPSSSEDKASSAAASAPAMTVSIRGLKQVGELSQLYWLDRSVEPVYQVDVTLHDMAVGVVNTARFDFSESGLTTPLIPVSAVAGLDRFNRIRFEGQAGLEQGTPAGQYQLDIEQLDMVPLSPYVTQAMGYRIQKGMLELDVDLGITNGQMEGEADITLQNSRFEPADEAVIASVSKQIAMPVETALSVLKDDQNNIELDVPLSGPLDDPNVGIQDVLSKISTSAVRAATVFYLQQSIQPYGALISLGSLVSDELFAIRLDPLDYQPYQYQLTAKQDDYLKHVVALMSSKPELELQVCPFYSAAEAALPEVNKTTTTAESSATTLSTSPTTPSTTSPTTETQTETAARLSGQALAQERAVVIKQLLAGYQDDKQRSLARRVTLCAPQQGEKAVVEMGF